MKKPTRNQRLFSSSPCMMHETDPAYHGFFGNHEIASLLVTWLHAARAIVQVCKQLLDSAEPDHRQLITEILDTEKNSCRVLEENLQMLGVSADDIVGDFYEKWLAIRGFEKQLQCLVNEKKCVLEKIGHALPRISILPVQNQLGVMVEDQRRNLNRMNNFFIANSIDNAAARKAGASDKS